MVARQDPDARELAGVCWEKAGRVLKDAADTMSCIVMRLTGDRQISSSSPAAACTRPAVSSMRSSAPILATVVRLPRGVPSADGDRLGVQYVAVSFVTYRAGLT